MTPEEELEWSRIQFRVQYTWANRNKTKGDTMYPKLIGLAGPARHGKDSLAAHLESHYGYLSIAFANPIKHALHTMFPWAADRYFETAKEEPIPIINKSYRELAQTLGTEWGRNTVDPNLWVNVMSYRIGAVSDLTAIVIPDVRFENEAVFIKDNGGILWHIHREDAPAVRAHESEAGVARLEGEPLFYNTTLDELYHQADAWLAAYRENRQ
jgi:hypothetical protein